MIALLRLRNDKSLSAQPRQRFAYRAETDLMRFRDVVDAELGAGLDMTGKDVGAERIINLFGLSLWGHFGLACRQSERTRLGGPVSPVLSFDFQGTSRRGRRTERSAQPWESNSIPLLQPTLPTRTDFKSQSTFYVE